MVLGATPLAFAAIRAFATRSDLRFVWMAFASLLGAALVMKLGRVRSRGSRGVFAIAVVAFFVAAVFGAVTATFVGARSALSVWFVATGFAFCSSTGLALAAISSLSPGQVSLASK